MTVFLIIVVIALLGVTFWQMSKILKLSKTGHEDSTQVANDNDNKNQGEITYKSSPKKDKDSTQYIQLQSQNEEETQS